MSTFEDTIPTNIGTHLVSGVPTLRSLARGGQCGSKHMYMYMCMYMYVCDMCNGTARTVARLAVRCLDFQNLTTWMIADGWIGCRLVVWWTSIKRLVGSPTISR